MKNCSVFVACMLISVGLFAQHKKNSIQYNTLNLLNNSAPLHLGYERVFTEHLSLEINGGYFKTPDLYPPTGNRTEDWAATYPQAYEQMQEFYGLFSVGQPDTGTINCAYHQRGYFVQVGPKLYCNKSHYKLRLYFNPELQLYFYQKDNYQFTRRDAGGYNYNLSANIEKNVPETAVRAALNTGLQFKIKEGFFIELDVLMGITKGNLRSKKQKAKYYVPEELKQTPETPFLSALTLPMQLKIGYQF